MRALEAVVPVVVLPQVAARRFGARHRFPVPICVHVVGREDPRGQVLPRRDRCFRTAFVRGSRVRSNATGVRAATCVDLGGCAPVAACSDARRHISGPIGPVKGRGRSRWRARHVAASARAPETGCYTSRYCTFHVDETLFHHIYSLQSACQRLVRDRVGGPTAHRDNPLPGGRGRADERPADSGQRHRDVGGDTRSHVRSRYHFRRHLAERSSESDNPPGRPSRSEPNRCGRAFRARPHDDLGGCGLRIT